MKIRLYPFDNDDIRHILIFHDLGLKETRFILYMGSDSLPISEMVKLQEAMSAALAHAEKLQNTDTKASNS